VTEPGFSLKKLDHICLAVRSIADACRLFVDVLGAEFIGGGDNSELGVRAVQLRLPPGSKIELLEPLDPDGFLARYLDTNGEGFHHMTAYVDDIPLAVKALTSAGYEVVDTSTERKSWQETFLRPSSGFGALIQLARPETAWESPIAGIELRDVLEGKVRVLGNIVSRMDTGEVLQPRSSD
jgi:methylmalonyl-CoA/ethylmalonyl-CoA epimerase